MSESAAKQSVLGIDAAWTSNQPSGVALVAQQHGQWRLLRVASSYAAFLGIETSTAVGKFDAAGLVAASTAATGTRPTLIAADIPLSHSPITSRRTSDNLVSQAYGSRHASTHTPSATRPGPVGEQIKVGFAREGFSLQTRRPVSHGLIEVYPHPALIELAGAAVRLPYKEGKVRKYWPDLTMPERRVRLLAEWDVILTLLDAQIAGVRSAFAPLSPPVPRRQLKAYEDALDAVVCAWVGICVLEGRAAPFGDAESAIWIPRY